MASSNLFRGTFLGHTPRIEDNRAYYVLSLYPYPYLFGTRVVKFHVVERYGRVWRLFNPRRITLLPFRATYFERLMK